MTDTDGQGRVAVSWVLVVVVVVDREAPHLDRVPRVPMVSRVPRVPMVPRVPLHHAVLVVDDGRGLAAGHLMF